MKKTLFLLLLACLGTILAGVAQPLTCTTPGTVFRYAEYNTKGKLTGYSERVVISAQQAKDGSLLVIEEEQALDAQKKPRFDEGSGIEATPQTVMIYLSDTEMRMPLNEMLTALTGGVAAAAAAGVQVKITGDENLVYPLAPAAGQKLPDTEITLTATQAGQSLSITLTFDERSVIGRESVTVPAGTYSDALKISERQTGKSIMFTQSVVETSWYAPNIGVVRTEMFTRNGKQTGYSELMEIEQPE